MGSVSMFPSPPLSSSLFFSFASKVADQQFRRQSEDFRANKYVLWLKLILFIY